MKHSRWSGRRVMPSGGGWMMPNPNGGVAACLVWSGHQTTAAAMRSKASDEPEPEQEQSHMQIPATHGDVNVCRSSVTHIEGFLPARCCSVLARY